VATHRRAAFLNPGRDLAGGVDLARRAEGLGYESVWVTHGSGRDSFLVLAAYGAATTRLGLGNGVVPIYLGVSHRASMEAMLGLTLREPLAVMREYVAVLRGALGGGAAFEGRHYRVKWSLAVPERPPTPPLYLAALSRNMLELAGEIADGVVLWLCSPGYVRDVAIPALQRGRARAGKTLAGFDDKGKAWPETRLAKRHQEWSAETSALRQAIKDEEAWMRAQIQEGEKLRAEGGLVIAKKADAAEFWYVDRLRGESAAGVAGIHVHPLEGTSGRITITKTF